ncbi:MAG: hypothetical protein IPO07_19670 [Haliscomenobacter sp.]|nr:element excision factor XisH family protein [Haliscomenobacter sp.]MBK9490749.1 hypothetical protein [Haliscomenobacter sp.]
MACFWLNCKFLRYAYYYLAVGNAIFSDFFLEVPIKKVWELYQVNVLVFDETKQTIIKWIQ